MKLNSKLTVYVDVLSQLALRRRELKITQKELAAKLDRTIRTVSGWENAEHTPKLETLVAWAEALDVELNISIDKPIETIESLEES